MSGVVRILDQHGRPMDRQRPKALGLVGSSNVPYDAADRLGAHVADWNPYLWSPDGELNPWRDTRTQITIYPPT